MSIPGSVRESCGFCFRECKSFRSVRFGSSSSVEWTGVSCFDGTKFDEVGIPHGVHELVLVTEAQITLVRESSRAQRWHHYFFACCHEHTPGLCGNLKPEPNPDDSSHGHNLSLYAQR